VARGAVAYFGDGDECHMAFHSRHAAAIMAIHREDRFRSPNHGPDRRPSPDTANGMFLRNHDELTLEMVTDEGNATTCTLRTARENRPHQPRIRRRLAPLLTTTGRRNRAQ